MAICIVPTPKQGVSKQREGRSTGEEDRGAEAWSGSRVSLWASQHHLCPASQPPRDAVRTVPGG